MFEVTAGRRKSWLILFYARELKLRVLELVKSNLQRLLPAFMA